jgi:hypothetical protein
MNIFSLAVPLLYFLLVLGLCTFLIVRGITHVFVGLFAGGALLHLIQSLGYVALNQAPGGYSANARYFPFLAIFGGLGTLAFAVGFVLLTGYLLRPASPTA